MIRTRTEHWSMIHVLAMVLAAAFTALPAGAAERLVLDLAPGSVLSLEGDSNVHRFHSTASVLKLDASFRTESGSPAEALRASSPLDLQVTVPVKGLKSGKSKLDDNMYSALKEKENPEIVWRLTGYQLPAEAAAADSAVVDAAGTLRVAGKERPVTIKARIRVVEHQLQIHGDVPLRMTDFGIKPPTMMLGTMRTKDDVVVHFDLDLVAAR